jgi:hypothetical protein
MIVVIPSNRRIELSHLGPLIDCNARFVVVDDSEGSISIDHPRFKVYNWNDRRRMLGPLDNYFPRSNGACRSFGFWRAWHDSDPGEIVLALDDDCQIVDSDFADQVARSLSAESRPVATTAGDHLNIIDLYDGNDASLFPRGFPYSARADYARTHLVADQSRNVVFSLGLWRGIYDINAVDKVTGRTYTFPEPRLRHRSVLVAPGKLVSVCSMNMQFRREVLPAAYQLPMHIPVVPDGVIDRYGDIWGGFILKTLIDIRGDGLAVGAPMITHLKEGDYVRNIWQENLAHQVNDEFLRLLSTAAAGLAPGSYLEMMQILTEEFRRRAAACSPILARYLAHLVPALEAWTKALMSRG